MSVRLRCPYCSKQGKIEISEESHKNMIRGVLTVNVAKGTICEHSFIAYVDKNYQVRDYFTPDFQLELSEESQKEEIKKIIPYKEKLNVDLIKLNFPPALLAYSLRLIFFKKNLILVLKESFLKDHFRAFYEFITQHSFEFNFTFLDTNEYKERFSEFKECMVIKDNELLVNNGAMENQNKVDVENDMIRPFFDENDPNVSLIFLENEMQKVYEFAKKLRELIEQTENKDNLTTKKMGKFLKVETHEKISERYLDLILDIVEHYFETKIPKRSNVSNLLDIL